MYLNNQIFVEYRFIKSNQGISESGNILLSSQNRQSRLNDFSWETNSK